MKDDGTTTMDEPLDKAVTAFQGTRMLASGRLLEVARTVKRAVEREDEEPVRVFDDATGRLVELDLRGSADEVVQRLAGHPAGVPTVGAGAGAPRPGELPGGPQTGEASDGPAGDPSGARRADERSETPPAGRPNRRRGRPKLGVVAREVTLLPRHWAWLGTQRGGASAALRRLVDEARNRYEHRDRVRQAQDSAYRFMSKMAGNEAGFEEAIRALYAGDRARFEAESEGWPEDVRRHAHELAEGAFAPDPEEKD